MLSTSFIRSEASKYAAPTNVEGVLELNYQRNHSRFLTIAPHAQYLCELDNHPGAQLRHPGNSARAHTLTPYANRPL